MPQVAIIGAGLIGRSWAIVFARAGWDVALCDADPGQCLRREPLIEASVADLAAHGLLEDAAGAAARVRVAADLADAVERADFVQENLPESAEAKAAIFRELDRLAPPDVVPPPFPSPVLACP